MSLSPCPSREQLCAFVSGRSDSFESIADHIEHCPACESIVRELEAAPDSAVEKLRLQAPADAYAAESECRRALAKVMSLGRRAADRSADNLDSSAGAYARPDDRPSSTSNILAEHVTGPERFRILRPHAKGALGQVSVAVDEELHREVALKEIQERFAGNPESRARFLLEAEITGGLEHPGIVPVYSLGTHADGRPFYAMRLIRGESLKDAIAAFHGHAQKTGVAFHSLEFRQLLGRFNAVCNAVAYAHSRGVLHRDIKPGNIMLGKYGETLVVDWGLAKAGMRGEQKGVNTGASGEQWTIPALHADENPLDPEWGSYDMTRTGSVLGTLAYMSPEQAAGQLDQLGPASDIYGLGATLYQTLVGAPPFERAAEDPRGPPINFRIQQGDFPRPRQINADIPRPLEAVCLKAMALKPEDRYSTPLALAGEIEHWLADEPVTAWAEPWTVKTRRWVGRHRTLVTAGGASLIVAFVGLIVALSLLGAKARAELLLARRHLYPVRMHAIAADWDRGDLSSVRQELEALQPESGQPDIRGFECWYFWSRYHSCRATMQGHNGAVLSVAFSPDGKTLATGSADESAKLWDLSVAKELTGPRINAHGIVRAVEFARGGRELIFANDWSIKRWDLVAGEWGRDLLPTDCVAAFTRGGQLVVTAADNEPIIVWDWATRKQLAKFQGNASVPTDCMALSPDERRLAWAHSGGKVRVWDVVQKRPFDDVQAHEAPIRAMAFSPDGAMLATCRDGTVKLWTISEKKLKLQATLAHPGRLNALAFSPDGKVLASAGAESAGAPPAGRGEIKLWDTGIAQETATFHGHAGAVRSLAFSPDGRLLASASNDRTAKLWDITIAKASAPPERLGRTNIGLPAATSIAFSPDASKIVTASLDGTAKILDVSSGKEVVTLQGHSKPIRSTAFSPQGRIVATASLDKLLILWDSTTGKSISKVKHLQALHCVTFSPDGKELAVGGDNGLLTMWDALATKELPSFGQPTGSVRCLAFSLDGKILATGTGDGAITLWDRSGKSKRIAQAVGKPVESMAFSLDGRLLAFAIDDQISFWAVPQLANSGIDGVVAKIEDSQRGGTRFRSLAFFPNSKMLATADHYGDGYGTLIRWQLHGDSEAQKRFVGRVRNPDIVLSCASGTNCVACSRDGKLVAAAGEDGTVTIVNALTWRVRSRHPGHARAIRCLVYSPDGKTLAIGERDFTVRLVDARTLQERAVLAGHKATVSCVNFSPDGKLVASASFDGTAKVWNAASGAELKTLEGHEDSLWTVAFGPDGARLATGDEDGVVSIWALPTGKKIHTLKQRFGVRAAAFSPDAGTLACVTAYNFPLPGEVNLWNPATGQLRATPSGHDLPIYCLAFSPDGQILATAGAGSPNLKGQGLINLWDLGRVSEGKEPTAPLDRHTLLASGPVRCSAFTPDGKTLATASGNTIEFWDPVLAREKGKLQRYHDLPENGEVTSLGFSPDGRALAIAATDGVVRVWRTMGPKDVER